MEVDNVSRVSIAPVTLQATPTKQAPAQSSSSVEQAAIAGADGLSSSITVKEPEDLQSKNHSNTERADERWQPDGEASEKMLRMAIDEANKKLANSHRMLQASMHDRTNRIMVKVIDTESEEVIREIPPEKTLDLFAKVLEMAGILLDERK